MFVSRILELIFWIQFLQLLKCYFFFLHWFGFFELSYNAANACWILIFLKVFFLFCLHIHYAAFDLWFLLSFKVCFFGLQILCFFEAWFYWAFAPVSFDGIFCSFLRRLHCGFLLAYLEVGFGIAAFDWPFLFFFRVGFCFIQVLRLLIGLFTGRIWLHLVLRLLIGQFLFFQVGCESFKSDAFAF